MKQVTDFITKHTWLSAIILWQFNAAIFILHRYFTNLVDPTEINWMAFIVSLESLHIGFTVVSVLLFRYLTKHSPSTISRWLLVSISVALIASLLTTFLFAVSLYLLPGHLGFKSDDLAGRILRMLVSSPIICWIVTLLLLMLFNALKYFRNYEEQQLRQSKLQEELTSSQLQLLRMQINPHFLFNSFNTISMMIRTGRSTEANNMLALVADLFRTSLMNNSSQLTSLQEEVALSEQYLKIESIRYADRLQIIMAVDPKAQSCMVPSIILQPLIENAFKHSLFENLNTVQLLQLNAILVEKKTLLLEVRNTGRIKEPLNKDGIGIRNVKDRLNHLYGEGATFTLMEEGEEVVARIEIQL